MTAQLPERVRFRLADELRRAAALLESGYAREAHEQALVTAEKIGTGLAQAEDAAELARREELER